MTENVQKFFLDPFKGLLFFDSYLIFHKKFFGLTSRPQEVKKIKAPWLQTGAEHGQDDLPAQPMVAPFHPVQLVLGTAPYFYHRITCT